MMKKALVVATAYAMAVPAVQAALPAEVDLYGSLRLGFESVNPDSESQFGDYTAFRDAYSRVGGSVTTKLSDTITASFKIEIPLDLANLEQQRPDQFSDDIRIFKGQISGNFGTVWVGKDWMPFYNAIAYPVDYFDSYYSGFVTTTTTRIEDTVAYISPSLNGLTLATSISKEPNGAEDNRFQFTASYAATDKLTIAFGHDDPGGDDALEVQGLAVTYNDGPLYLGAKVERFNTNLTSGYGEDGDISAAVIAQYSFGKSTVSGLVGHFDNFGEDIFHLGYSYKVLPNVKLFAEYYDEEQSAALAEERKSSLDGRGLGAGGNVFTTGIRYDF